MSLFNFDSLKWWKKKDTVLNNGYGGFGFGSKISIGNVYTTKQDNKLLTERFNNISEFAAPILKYVDGMRQVNVTANIPEVQKLIDNPNYYQKGADHWPLLMLHKRLYGEAIENFFVTNSIDGGRKPKSLFLFHPTYTAIQTEKNQDFRFNSIKQYLFKDPKNTTFVQEIEPENILHLKDSHPNFDNEQYLFGISKYVTSSNSAMSISGGYSAKVNLFENGPRFAFVGKSQGEFAALSDTEDIEIVQKRFSLYGWAKEKFNNLITDKPLEVHNLSLDVRKLMINENNKADFERLCDAQNIDAKIFSGPSKFADSAQALSDFYNNAFRSEVDSIYKELETKLKTWWPSLVLTVDYSQISEITDAQNKERLRILEEAEKGLITRNEYLEKTNQEPRTEPEFNQLYVLTNTNQWLPVSIPPLTVNSNTNGQEINQGAN